MAFRLLALGDSYTAGEGVKPHARWPNQLARMLVDEGCPVESPRIVARTGWTTAGLLEGLRHATVTGCFDMVTLLIGVNNQFRGLPLDEYEEEFELLVGRAVRYARHRPERVVVLSIPDWGVTPYAEGRDRSEIAARIDAFNRLNRRIAAEAGAAYVDVTAFSREAAGNPAMLVRDGLHPSEAQYAAWARIVLLEARRLCEG